MLEASYCLYISIVRSLYDVPSVHIILSHNILIPIMDTSESESSSSSGGDAIVPHPVNIGNFNAPLVIRDLRPRPLLPYEDGDSTGEEDDAAADEDAPPNDDDAPVDEPMAESDAQGTLRNIFDDIGEELRRPAGHVSANTLGDLFHDLDSHITSHDELTFQDVETNRGLAKICNAIEWANENMRHDEQAIEPLIGIVRDAARTTYNTLYRDEAPRPNRLRFKRHVNRVHFLNPTDSDVDSNQDGFDLEQAQGQAMLMIFNNNRMEANVTRRRIWHEWLYYLNHLRTTNQLGPYMAFQATVQQAFDNGDYPFPPVTMPWTWEGELLAAVQSHPTGNVQDSDDDTINHPFP